MVGLPDKYLNSDCCLRCVVIQAHFFHLLDNLISIHECQSLPTSLRFTHLSQAYLLFLFKVREQIIQIINEAEVGFNIMLIL